ncbi:MAG TPA: nucleotide disphospho-sugar-binding domain-containing protein [Candidatus Dormibacteraeota bacterium]|nr:nucleotide disphospho-sugar-binding domain-containing protein [Candidatus Dormibacteraeota bacterium]
MKIGFVSMPFSGHLNPMTGLARKLQSRGNEVVFFGVPDVEPFARAAGLDFVPYGEAEFPVGSIDRLYGSVATMRGFEVVRHTCMDLNPHLTRVTFDYLDEKITTTGVEALVIDTIHFFIELVPLSMSIPYVHIWNVLHLDFSGATPPSLFSSPLDTSPEGLKRNAENIQKMGAILGPLAEVARSYAKRVGLKVAWNDPGATVSKLAVITQTPKEFDFPGIPWPAHFHYAGPFHDDKGREPVPFPWGQLTGKPVIYGSLGTLVNGLGDVYKHILKAVEPVEDVQLILSVGNNISPESLGRIPANAIVVRSAPQIELLKRAALCITHAGLNTVLESLAQGVPMVAIPIAYDQPGTAARIAYHGVGELVELDELTTERLRGLIEKVLQDPSYRERAGYFRKVISKTRGLDVAANIIEQAFQKYQTEVLQPSLVGTGPRRT